PEAGADDADGPAVNLRALGLVAIAGLLATGQKCDVEKRVCGDGKLVNRDGQIRCEYPTTTLPEPTTTSTSSTTTTTTTFVLPTTTTTTLPPVAPKPSPTCIPEQPMPSGPVTTANGLAPSSCEHPSENMACFKNRGDEAIYVEG